MDNQNTSNNKAQSADINMPEASLRTLKSDLTLIQSQPQAVHQQFMQSNLGQKQSGGDQTQMADLQSFSTPVMSASSVIKDNLSEDQFNFSSNKVNSSLELDKLSISTPLSASIPITIQTSGPAVASSLSSLDTTPPLTFQRSTYEPKPLQAFNDTTLNIADIKLTDDDEKEDKFELAALHSNLTEPTPLPVTSPSISPINKPASTSKQMSDIKSRVDPSESLDFETNKTNSKNTLSKLKSKKLLVGGAVIVAFGVIGIGSYSLWKTNKSIPNTSDNIEQSNMNTADQVTQGSTLIKTDSNIKVTGETQDLKKNINNSLVSQSAELIKLDLVDTKGSVLSLETIQSIFGITFNPALLSSAQDYTLVSYNDSGTYKIGIVIKTKDNLEGSLYNSWSKTIVTDLSGFTLDSIKRTTKITKMNSSKQTNPVTNEVYTNFYTNFSPDSSIDFNVKNNLILIASSQNTMTGMIKNVVSK